MDTSQLCALCGKSNDQMLMLSCIHDPCINCAATAYADQVHIKGQSSQVYVCEICGEQTNLDHSTISELNILARSVIKSPSKPLKGTTSTSKNKSIGPASTTNLTKAQGASKKTIQKKAKYYCKEHSQEQISYYCFTCWTTICPECAIHGSHKDHQVKLVKKAISQVKTQYMEIINKIGVSQNKTIKFKQAYLKLVKETNDRHTREKNLISRQFENLRNSLIAKQKQFQKQLDEINKQNIQLLTSAMEKIHESHEELLKIKKGVELILKKDEVLILQQFKKIKEPDQKIDQVSKSVEIVSGQISHLNIDFLQQQTRQINEKISAMKLNQKKQEISQLLGIKSQKTKPPPPPPSQQPRPNQ